MSGHAESYNPPAEYLFSAEEQQRWEDDDPLERVPNFMPKKYDTSIQGLRLFNCFVLVRYAALRNVPAYQNFVQERFSRCLDLYLCPRSVRMRVSLPLLMRSHLTFVVAPDQRPVCADPENTQTARVQAVPGLAIAGLQMLISFN